MALFDAMSIAGSGLTVHRKWLDAVSDNLSNMNNVSATDADTFQQRYVVAQAVDYGSGRGGATVAGVVYGSGEGRLVYEPEHPLADENGNVKYPNIDLGSQMTSLMMAQRGYQANLAVVERAQNAYQAALQLGEWSLMSLDPISLGGSLGAGFGMPTMPVAPTGAGQGLAPAEKSALGLDGTSGANFGSILANQISGIQQAQGAADTAAVQAATGDLTDVHDYMIKSQQAQLTTELTVAVRDKAVAAFNEILRMQV